MTNHVTSLWHHQQPQLQQQQWRQQQQPGTRTWTWTRTHYHQPQQLVAFALCWSFRRHCPGLSSLPLPSLGGFGLKCCSLEEELACGAHVAERHGQQGHWEKLFWNMYIYYISASSLKYGYLMFFSVFMWNFGGVREEMGPGRRHFGSRGSQWNANDSEADQDAACDGHAVTAKWRDVALIMRVWFELCTCATRVMCFKHLAVLGLEMQCVGIGNAMCWDWKCNDPCMVKMSPVNVSEVTWRVHKVFKPKKDNPTVVLVQLRCCSCSYPFRSYTAGYLRVAFRILIAWFSEYSLMAFPYIWSISSLCCLMALVKVTGLLVACLCCIR